MKTEQMGNHPRRWVYSANLHHAVYEQDGSSCFTLCGLLVMTGDYTFAKPGNVKDKCPTCVNHIASTMAVCGADERKQTGVDRTVRIPKKRKTT